MFGRLSWAAIPFDVPVVMIAAGSVGFLIFCVLALVTVKGWWPYLWREWITSVDHKRIGVMYIGLALLMLVRGFSDAMLMRSQLALAAGHAQGYLPPEHYDQIFSAHGTIMIFFVAMPFVVGLMNFAVPLQLGVRDVAFPKLNSVSFWLTASGVLLVNLSLFVGEFARTGWLAFPTLSGLAYSPGVVAAFPVLTATFAMLLLDRYCGFHFFTNELGGNPMMYVNLIWIWGHPEVYILILPAFGVFSEVVSTFSGKRLFGYASMVYATVVITTLSYLVWLHHFFTMGSGASVNSFFGITTMIISIPSGAKMFNWLFTMYRGRIRFELPMLWTLGFMIPFVIGGMTGVLLAVPPADFVLHNSLFLVAHFHNVIIGGVLFGMLAGITYWFPKAFGYRLDPFWGKCSFWFWVTGFYFAFMPLYVLGLMGVTRRLNHFDDPSLQIWFQIAAFGAVLILF